MIFNINIDQDSFSIEVSDELMKELTPILEDMDKEFDQGCQMGRFWVEKPSDEQRCQVSANNFVNAMHSENKRMIYLMAAYILRKFPTLRGVTINSDLEMHEIDIHR